MSSASAWPCCCLFGGNLYGCSTAELTRNKIRKFSSQIPFLCPLQVLDLAAVFSVETCTVALPLSYRGILCGNDLSSRQVTLQVLSARQSLTSVFGMRTGGPLRYHHHNGYIICILYTGYIRLFSVEHWQLHRSVYHNLFLFRTFGLFLSEYLLFIYAISYCFCLFFFQNKHSTY